MAYCLNLTLFKGQLFHSYLVILRLSLKDGDPLRLGMELDLDRERDLERDLELLE